MKTEVAYCSGCGHKVRLVFTDPPPRDGQENLPDGAEVVWLDDQGGVPIGSAGEFGVSQTVFDREESCNGQEDCCCGDGRYGRTVPAGIVSLRGGAAWCGVDT